jgi:hypothetical protein
MKLKMDTDGIFALWMFVVIPLCGLVLWVIVR